ncbi:hypothetical protein [Nocardioides sp. TF02-7]|nr:hypothetical protein [Nocardioides sp. TF02-7]UMG92148.1 hypothetical protein MF408_19795 [Nocardioides sp. TF02-7]
MTMNIVISALVGALASAAVLVAGVNAYQNSSAQKPVSEAELYTYSSE